MSMEDDIQQLVDAGLMSERQAEAWVLRDLELVPRPAVAESMGISVNTLDKRLREARDKVEAAEATVEAVRDLRHEEIPSECDECGSALAGQWAETDHGQVLCPECAGVEL